ncbi:MAG: MBL fold metallo-hydrolase [Candidatus Limnocylindrales bacterium]
MIVTIWGSRGSIASAGPETDGYGGNTACVTVEAPGDVVIVLDAGSGLRRAGKLLAGDGRIVHLLITHLHMDHIQGLGFFRPLFEAGREVHVWGPPSTTESLRQRLGRYLSPPLFPVRLRDVPATVTFHDARTDVWRLGGFGVRAATIIHPGPTVGYRIASGGHALAYLPDHEPALGGVHAAAEWTSGHDLAAGVDLLIHDAQYTPDEYAERLGWGHSTVGHAAALADQAGARRLLLFHHEPDHDDATIDGMVAEAKALRREGEADGACEGMNLEI